MPPPDVPEDKPAVTAPKGGLPPAAPEVAQEKPGEAIDSVAPTRVYQQLPMVGLGGSAGALAPLQRFFQAMPPNPGIAFVVVMHLLPDHVSNIAELLQRSTPMRVVRATDGVKVEANSVYVIPPGKHLTTSDSHLKLGEFGRDHGRRLTVDLFFRSMADTHGPHAVAVVLSGADADGTIGIKRIKEHGGLTIVQDPAEAEYSNMPCSAMATGMVDWVLPAAQMPERILDYVARQGRLQLPPEDGLPPGQPPRPAPTEPEMALREVLVFLRLRTGRDFSHYKRATILRRVSRRMQVNAVDNLPGYLTFLRTNPGEAGALLKDLLISVTNFFRDRDSFQALESRIPDLFKDKGENDSVRVWVPACATGEEAYSVAILLLEAAQKIKVPPSIQIFGCDLDDEAVQVARTGVYPETITADVSPERLQRFFIKDRRGYRVRGELRETVLFATHDLLKDAPFSRLDLISCRNLLIYLDREAQSRVLDIFHFALKPSGLLFLGASETVDESNPLFEVVDKKHRIYLHRPAARMGVPVPVPPGSPSLASRIREEGEREHALPRADLIRSASVALAVAPDTQSLPWSELHFKLIERFAPPSLIVNADYDIQHLSENAGRFLQHVGGLPTTNLLRLVHPMLRVELRAVLFRASQSGEPAAAPRVPMEIAGVRSAVDMRVCPAGDIAPGFLLVVFDPHEVTESPAATAIPTAGQDEGVVQHLERELDQMRLHLRDTVEQYEASTEELKASNEELQAMNEELRSATEELETSREELQSINEELTTVNAELKAKVEELANANSDLQNFMGATAIATLFLDRDLKIMRFTNSAVSIFHFIPNDVGRPLSDLQKRLDYPDLAADAGTVLGQLTPVEREVRSMDGRCFLSRMVPYRTVNDRIAGVVLTLVDITERHKIQRYLAEDLRATERLRVVSEPITPPVGLQALFAEILEAAIEVTHSDAGHVQLLDQATQELRLLTSHGLDQGMTGHWTRVDASSGTRLGVVLASGKRALMDFDIPGAPDPDGSNRLSVQAGFRSGQSTPLIARSGKPLGMLSTHWRGHHAPTERELRFLDLLARQASDAIERKQAEDALREHVEELTRFNNVAVGRESRMIELKKEINELCTRFGVAARYSVDFDREPTDTPASPPS